MFWPTAKIPPPGLRRLDQRFLSLAWGFGLAERLEKVLQV
jgi:hypothetical protein